MPRYVDGFLLAVSKRKLERYRRLSRKVGKIWRDHGALEYVECVGDDLKAEHTVSFRRGLKLKPGEAVVFSWIIYRSRASRDRVNAKVMKDPRMVRVMRDEDMPFDMKRLAFGGFNVIVDM